MQINNEYVTIYNMDTLIVSVLVDLLRIFGSFRAVGASCAARLIVSRISTNMGWRNKNRKIVTVLELKRFNFNIRKLETFWKAEVFIRTSTKQFTLLVPQMRIENIKKKEKTPSFKYFEFFHKLCFSFRASWSLITEII